MSSSATKPYSYAPESLTTSIQASFSPLALVLESSHPLSHRASCSLPTVYVFQGPDAFLITHSAYQQRVPRSAKELETYLDTLHRNSQSFDSLESARRFVLGTSSESMGVSVDYKDRADLLSLLGLRLDSSSDSYDPEPEFESETEAVLEPLEVLSVS